MTVVAATSGWIQRDLGANHYMWTHAELHDNGWLTGETRTASFTWFGGFTGDLTLAVLDENGVAVCPAPPSQSYGVDGTWIGRSDRTDPWWFFIGDGVARPGLQIKVAQYWHGIKLEDVIKVGERIAPFVAWLFA